jgi:beta-glucanase (GH16 family)
MNWQRSSAILLSLVVLLIAGCGGGSASGGSSQPGLGRATFSITWPKSTSKVVPSGSDAIGLTLSTSGGTVVATGLVAKPSTSWTTGELNPGTYTLVANAVPNADGSGVVQATGTTSVQITANQVTQTSLTMGSTVSSVQVALASSSIAMGLTDQATATCYDSKGEVVLVGSGTLGWSTSDSTKASVDGNGLVTAISVGTPTVTATFTEIESSLGQSPVKGQSPSLSVTTDYSYAPSGYKIVWSDEFNGVLGSTPNSANWTYDLGNGGWGNSEQETYTNSNATIVADQNAIDGKALDIQARDTNGEITSARIKTEGLQSFTYGYICCRAKVPPGGSNYQGYWPAFWMLGNSIDSVGWPTCGEDDVMEHLSGTEPDLSYQSLHGNYSGSTSEWTTSSSANAGTDTGLAYHTYAVLWLKDSITFYVDGVQDGPTQTPSTIGSNAVWQFDQPEFIILNMAVGGNWPGNTTSSTVFPADFMIDYVRVYQ